MTTILKQLPLPKNSKKGWPWAQESIILPKLTPEGLPWPKISIVTPSFNQGQFIEETIRSVLLQNYPNLEYIIIDGGSTDNSVEIIKQYEPWLTHWVSEKDSGQSHAINKGLKTCTGDIIAWINSDDLLEIDTLNYVASNINIEEAAWFIGASQLIDSFGKHKKVRKPPIAVSKETFLLWVDNWFPQQSTFWNRKMQEKIGILDTSLHYVMDVDLWYRMTMLAQPIIVEKVISKYRIHNNAKTIIFNEKSNSELSFWTYHNFITPTKEGYENFCKILIELIKLQTSISRLKTHPVIGRVIRLWGQYVNPDINKII